MIPGRGAVDMHNIEDSWRATVYPQQRGRNDPIKQLQKIGKKRKINKIIVKHVKK